MKYIAIFASGNGSNAENIIRHFADRPEAGRVEFVVCNRPGAGVIARAKALGVPVYILTKEEINDPAIMLPLMEKHHIDLIVLAGFLLMIPGFLTSLYGGRIINVHPSLLPAYGGKGMYGRRVHEAVIAAGEKVSGITIHYVTDVYDDGKVIFQAETEVDPDDTPDTLEAKIHSLERIHFPRVIEELLNQ